MRLEREHTVALIIDYQEKLVPVMYEKESLLSCSEILLKGLNVLEIPMKITQQYTKGLGTTVENITEAIGHTEYVDKISFSAYDCVKDFVKDKKYVIVCGIETHICVLQTVLDLVAEGHTPVVVEDCVSSRNQKDKDVALIRMREEGAIVTTYESLLFELLKVAGTEESKKIQRLIR